jgi:AcrR family transcriptional regulator
MATRLVETAARLLAEEGRDAVTARRLARELGTSTMVVYTHFGSMDDLMGEVLRTGFARFGEALERPAHTDDPVADWMAQGWEYRRFALENPDLYRVMFGRGLTALGSSEPADDEAAQATFVSLLRRIERCVEAGRWTVGDVFTAGEVVWASVHGHCTIELTGYFGAMARDPAKTYETGLLQLSVGFHDDEGEARASLASAKRRRRRTVAV